MEKPRPPVGRIRMPLDQTPRLEFVDDAAKRDRLDLQQVSQAALVDALVVRQIGQHLPLRPRQSGAARVLLKASPQQSRDLVQQKSKSRRIRFHGGSIRKLAYDKLTISAMLRMLANAANENRIFIAFGVERDAEMDRSNLADLTAFIAVADRLSFRAASSQLGVTPSALSHSMRQLEDRLGVRLLNRTTRSVSVTDAGLRLLEQLRPAINQIDGALEDLNQKRLRPMGRLRIYAVHVAAAAVIAPIWRRFLSTYPEVHLELAVGEAPIDLVAKGFDAGIGPRDRVPADLIAVRVMEPMKVAVVGAPTYFARRRPPRTPDDLAQHSCIQFRTP